MGYLKYGETRHEFDDRVLAHLKVAIQRKLKKHQSFLLSWEVVPPSTGRVSLWMSPAIPLTFHFSGARVAAINEVWATVLERSASTPRGMVVVSEDDAMRLIQKLAMPDAG